MKKILTIILSIMLLTACSTTENSIPVVIEMDEETTRKYNSSQQILSLIDMEYRSVELLVYTLNEILTYEHVLSDELIDLINASLNKVPSVDIDKVRSITDVELLDEATLDLISLDLSVHSVELYELLYSVLTKINLTQGDYLASEYSKDLSDIGALYASYLIKSGYHEYINVTLFDLTMTPYADNEDVWNLILNIEDILWDLRASREEELSNEEYTNVIQNKIDELETIIAANIITLSNVDTSNRTTYDYVFDMCLQEILSDSDD